MSYKWLVCILLLHILTFPNNAQGPVGKMIPDWDRRAVEGNPAWNSQHRSFTAVWEESFADTSLPTGWVLINRDASSQNGQPSGWMLRQEIRFISDSLLVIQPYVASSFLFSNFRNANALGVIDEWIISPKLPVTILNNDLLIFYAGAIGQDFDDSLRVLISTSDTLNCDSLEQDLDEIACFRVDGSGDSLALTWTEYSFDLSAYAYISVRIASII